MKKRKTGRRHRLLLYRRAMDRLWLATLVLGLILAVTWWQASAGEIPSLPPPRDSWAFVAALVTLMFTIFAMLARNMSYVQARDTHLRLVTPFLRLNVSYRRVRSVRAVEFHQLFRPREAGWGERRFLRPFYGHTAVVVEVFDYPLPVGLLRLFLAPQMFDPKGKGVVLLVEDWMGISTEIDSLRGEWVQTQKPSPSGLGLYH